MLEMPVGIHFPAFFFSLHYKLNNSLTSLSIVLPVSLLADFQPVDYIEAVIKMLNSHSSSTLKGSLVEKIWLFV